MGILANEARRNVNGYLVLGASLYWASTIVQLLPKGGSQAGLGSSAYDPSFATYVLFLCLAALVGTAALARFRFATQGSQRALAVVAFAAGALSFALSFFVGIVPHHAYVPFDLAWAFIRAIETAGLMLLWGLAFASLDKRTAGQTVILTVLCTMFLYCCLLGLHVQIPQARLTQVAYLASALFLLSGRVTFLNKARERAAGQRRSIGSFYASRAAFGFFSGLIGSLMAHVEVRQSDALIIASMAIIIGLLFACFFSKDGLYTALPVFPLIVAGLLFLPFLSTGMDAAGGAASSIIWTSWIVLTSFQLSDLKERYGMSEVEVCFSEKAALAVAWAAGMTLGRFAMDMRPSGAADGQIVVYASIAVAYTAVLYAIYSIFRLVYTRKEAELRNAMAMSEAERMERIYDDIVGEFGLSARERQVMAMLAQGYTRTFIKDELVISEGTARAHIAHVYQKLDVHKKDELLNLIKSRMQP